MIKRLAFACAALVLVACQPPPAEEATTAEAPAAVAATTAAAPAIPEGCSALAQRNWQALLAASGSSATLTISGEVDLPTPGYGVSLARDPNDAADATEAHLMLNLTPPAGMVAQVVSPTPVRYFGPAGPNYAVVHIMCGAGSLADVTVTRG